MVRKIYIGDRAVYEGERAFIIAEAGVNYYDIAIKKGISPISAAKIMIREAKRGGADAIKFQTYKAEKLASKKSPAYWDTTKEKTTSQYELFKKYDSFGRKEYKELAAYAKKEGIIFLSTPFDVESVDYLDELVPAFKVSSSDISNKPFLQYIAKKRKPILLSTGASTLEEIDEAIRWIRSVSNVDIALLHCILCYPTKDEDANLGMISSLYKRFPEYVIGYSDHTYPSDNMEVLTTAYTLGAVIIEKHFTLDKTIEGNDHFHSMDVSDLKNFRNRSEKIRKIIGSRHKDVAPCEENSRMYARRSLVALRTIHEGEVITREMITFKRPATGISPKYIDDVVGKRATTEIPEDEPLEWEMLK